MNDTIRREGHIAEKGKVCPSCGAKDTIEYWKRSQAVDITGKRLNDTVRCLPFCSACKKEFSKGTLFREIR